MGWKMSFEFGYTLYPAPVEVTPLYGLYGYVRPQKVWVLTVLIRNRASIMTILASSRIWFLHSRPELCIFLEAILTNKSI